MAQALWFIWWSGQIERMNARSFTKEAKVSLGPAGGVLNTRFLALGTLFPGDTPLSVLTDAGLGLSLTLLHTVSS
uniref:SFRICE_031768 n=1 Tax=Spodoptera frugiperda TaxID=7108 RepID=A0A2H1WC58_SPOFR